MTFVYIRIFRFGIRKIRIFVTISLVKICILYPYKYVYDKRKNAYVKNLKNSMNQEFLGFSFT